MDDIHEIRARIARGVAILNEIEAALPKQKRRSSGPFSERELRNALKLVKEGHTVKDIAHDMDRNELRLGRALREAFPNEYKPLGFRQPASRIRKGIALKGRPSPMKGRKHTNRSKEKMRRSAMGKNAGKKASIQTRLKQSAARKGKSPSNKGISSRPESVEKMRQKKIGQPAHNKGVPMSEGQKQKLRGPRAPDKRSPQMIQLREAGNSFQQIADAVKAQRQTVSRAIHRHRPDLVRMNLPHLPTQERKEIPSTKEALIIKHRENGMHYDVISNLMGCSKALVSVTITRWRPDLGGKLPYGKVPEMIKLREKGMSYRKISTKLDCPYSNVMAAIQRWRPDLCGGDIQEQEYKATWGPVKEALITDAKAGKPILTRETDGAAYGKPPSLQRSPFQQDLIARHILCSICLHDDRRCFRDWQYEYHSR